MHYKYLFAAARGVNVNFPQGSRPRAMAEDRSVRSRIQGDKERCPTKLFVKISKKEARGTEKIVKKIVRYSCRMIDTIKRIVYNIHKDKSDCAKEPRFA